MAVLARASVAELVDALSTAELAEPLRGAVLPAHTRLRGPETGLVMLRGRAGGQGQIFNLGEMPVTRCTVRAGGQVGHAYVTGRSAAQAELAARLDAALQDESLRPALLDAVIDPLAAAQTTRRATEAAQAAATRVEFFTMATMRS